MSEDKGHRKLIEDIEALLTDAREYQFHDYKNTRYEAPKLELLKRLNAMCEGVKNDRYDNQADEEDKEHLRKTAIEAGFNREQRRRLFGL